MNQVFADTNFTHHFRVGGLLLDTCKGKYV